MTGAFRTMKASCATTVVSHQTTAPPQDQGIDEDSSAPACVASQVGAGAQNVAICPLENPVRHVRIVGLTAARAHASTQLFLGLTEAAGPQAALTAGQFKLQLYGGGQPQPPPDLGAYFGLRLGGLRGAARLHQRASRPSAWTCTRARRAPAPQWCCGWTGTTVPTAKTRSTLTFANRYGHTSGRPSPGALNDHGVYFYQSGGTQTPVVTLSDTPAVAYEDVPPPDCTVADLSASPTARYVELCELDAPVRHVRITGLMTEAMHGTVSFLVGYPAPANTAAGPAGAGRRPAARAVLHRWAAARHRLPRRCHAGHRGLHVPLHGEHGVLRHPRRRRGHLALLRAVA
jgi:hypothetical protein